MPRAVFNLDPDAQAPYESKAGACPGQALEFHPFVFVAQEPHRVERFPQQDMGYSLPAHNGLMIQLQAINTDSMPVQASASVTLTRDTLGVVTKSVGHILLSNASVSVPVTPVSSPATVTQTWDPTASALPPLPATYSLFSSWSYMTRTGLELRATTNGSTFYDQRVAHPPSVVAHSPALSLTGSQSISWSCDFYNDGAGPLTFGDGPLSNAMCVYIGEYYPADPANPDRVDIQF